MPMHVLVAAALLVCVCLQVYAAWQRRNRSLGYQVAQASVGMIALLVMLWVMFFW